MEETARTKEETRTAQRAQMLGLRYFDTSTISEPPLFMDVLPLGDMYKNHAVVLNKDDSRMVIGITSKTPQQYLDHVAQSHTDIQTSFALISEAGHRQFMEKYDPPEEIEYKDVAITSDSSSQTLEAVSKTINEVLADDIFDYLLRQAVRLEASDVHLEGTRDAGVRIRFRVHGVLHDIAAISEDKNRQLMSTIATQADISTNSPNPQTGHITYKLDSNEINIRIETLATLFGQDVVLRVFTIHKDLLALDKLGLDEEEMNKIEDIVENPSGLVITVGPTGSGKTTTLYSIINKLNKPDLKIITLEDPVEYSLPGLVQVPVKTMKNESFADGLRSVLRMDPDVIMIGEIRDADTANTALQAALSGHLVLSTFHAFDTAAALARLLTFTKGNPLFTSALRLVIAQRLVRQLDDSSKKEYEPEDHIRQNIEDVLGDRYDKDKELKVFEAVPTDENPFGYSGRTAVIELLQMDESIERLIHEHGESLVANDVRDLAVTNGMKTLLVDAMEKVVEGKTTIEEVYRVI